MKILTQYKKNIFYFFLYILLLSCTNKVNTIKKPQEAIKDSITNWVKSSRNKSHTLDQKKQFLQKALIELRSSENNKSKTKKLSIVAYRYFQLNDTISFKKVNKEAQTLAYQLKDSFTIADTYWSTADYYQSREAYKKSYYYYNKTYDYFSKLKMERETALVLYAMAFIKGRFHDYNGSEVLTFKAIEKFKALKDNRQLYISYSHLGSLQNDIKEYDKAIYYHKKAQEYISSFEHKKKYHKAIYNNIGLAYHNKKKFSKAIEYFNKSLNNTERIIDYARVIDNRAFSKLQVNDTINVKKDFYQSLKINDSLKNKAGVVFNKIHISDYYKYIKDTIKAIKFSNEANKLAKQLKNGGYYLITLKQLAELEPHHSKKHLNQYIQFSDSLNNAERKVQNKFTRIEFETDEHIEESKRLSEQTILISITGIGLLLILSLAYFLRTQKSKNEKLVLEAEQQKANEQVYLLTLEQQAIIEEERVQERNRISEELHDGVLGRLFGTRVGLGFLDFEAPEETQKQHESFLEELQEIEKEIRDVSHKLSNNFSADQINFSTLIKQLLKTNSATGNFKHQISFDEDIAWKNINQLIKINIYRVVQESLQNIVKSAHAKNVILDFSIEESKLVLRIKDDGVGFDIKKAKKGIGIKNMKSRIQKLKGTLEIQSKMEQGTSILIQIPLEN